MSSTLNTDSVVGGYRIIDVVGQGGMGVVYRALQPSLDRRIALKVLAESLTQDARFRERFIRESRIAASIEHPHVLPVIEAGEDAGVLFIAMQYVPDGDLARLLRARGPMEPDAALAVLMQTASALDAAHARGLVHRDVKPGNLLVGEKDGQRHLYLTDFGVSSQHGSHSGLTSTDGWVGTVHYVAPEQIRGERVDRRADVYSLGCVFFQALTGKLPFARENEIATLWAHMRDDPPRASATPGVPPTVDLVVERALEKDPQRRYQSAGALAADAADALAGTTARVATRSTPRRGERRSRTRRVVTLAIASLAVAAAAALVLALVLPGRSGSDSSRSGERTVRTTAPVQPPPAERPVGVVLGKPIPVGSLPHAVAFGLGGVWVANSGDDTVSFIDPQTNRVVGPPIRVGQSPQAVEPQGRDVWVANRADNTVVRIKAHNRRVEGLPIHVGPEPYALVRAGHYVWVASEAHGTLSRIDPGQNAVAGQPVTVRGGLGGGLAADRLTLWAGSYISGTLRRFDARTGQQLGGPLALGGHPQAIALGARYAWVALTNPNVVVRVIRRTGHVVGHPIRVGSGPPTALALSGTDLWVTSGDGKLRRIDTRTHRLAGRPLRIGQITTSIAQGDGSLWTASQVDGTVTRIGPNH